MAAQISVKQIAPSSIFRDTNGNDCEQKSVCVNLTAGTSNNVMVTAVTGKRIRVLGLCAASGGAISQLTLKSGSGGTAIFQCLVPPQTGTIVNEILAPNELGWCDTATGIGLYADCGAVAVLTYIRYIEFTQTI